MARKRYYIGSTGPYLYDDSHTFDDGRAMEALRTEGQLVVDEAPSENGNVWRLHDMLLFLAQNVLPTEGQIVVTDNGDGSITLSLSSNLVMPGSVSYQTVNVIEDYTILDDDTVVHLNVTTGPLDKVINLPTRIDNIGRVIQVTKADSANGYAVVTPEIGDTILGDTELTIRSQYSSAHIKATNTEWVLI